MTTRSVDPAGQHQLPAATPVIGRKTTDYWNDQFPLFDVPFDQHLLPDSDDPKPLRPKALWLVAAGSDLLLQCEVLRGQPEAGKSFSDQVAEADVVVRAYDSSGNPMNVLGQFRDQASALVALPTLVTVAHMLYPNFLLMARDARHPGEREAGQVGDEPRRP